MIMDSLERIEGFRTKWPFAPRYARVNGWRMHYVDEGAGDPVLLLHGNPTWGFLYRAVGRRSGRQGSVGDPGLDDWQRGLAVDGGGPSGDRPALSHSRDGMSGH